MDKNRHEAHDDYSKAVLLVEAAETKLNMLKERDYVMMFSEYEKKKDTLNAEKVLKRCNEIRSNSYSRYLEALKEHDEDMRNRRVMEYQHYH